MSKTYLTLEAAENIVDNMYQKRWEECGVDDGNTIHMGNLDKLEYTELEKASIILLRTELRLKKENQQLKEQVEYLRRSIERKESTISEMEQERIPYTNEYVKHLEQQLQQKDDIINKAREHLELKIIRYSNETNYMLDETDLKEIIQILDNKGE